MSPIYKIIERANKDIKRNILDISTQHHATYLILSATSDFVNVTFSSLYHAELDGMNLYFNVIEKEWRKSV